MSEDLKQEIDNYIQNLIKNPDMQSLLYKFVDYQESNESRTKYYSKRKGVYAFFLKENIEFSKLGFKITASENEDELKTVQEKFYETNNKLEDTHKNLIYIGKTCSKKGFEGRVLGASGHMQGGVTNLTGKIFSYLTGIDRTLYYDKDKEKRYSNKLVENIDSYEFIKNKNAKNYTYKNLIKDWFTTFIDVKFYTVEIVDDDNNKLNNTDMVISIIEEALISLYQPALNDIGIDEKENCKCKEN